MPGTNGPTMDLRTRRRSIWDVPAEPDSSPSAPGAGVLLPLDRLWANPFNPRLVYDDAELDAMADSIKAEGILQDLMVAELGQFRTYWTRRLASSLNQQATLQDALADKPADHFVILIGHNRHAACARADLADAPCRIRNDKIDRARILGLPENLRRIKLNPIEEALGYQGAVEDGLTQTEIAAQVGCRQPHISRRLKLLLLEDELRDAVMSGALRSSDGELIAAALPDRRDRQLAVLDLMTARSINASAALAMLTARESPDGGTKASTAPPAPPHPRTTTDPTAVLEPTPLSADALAPAGHTPRPPTGVPPTRTAPETIPRPDQQTDIDTDADVEHRTTACRRALAAVASNGNPREILRLTTPALLIADLPAHLLAQRLLHSGTTSPPPPGELPFRHLVDGTGRRETQQAALAVALATLELRARTSPRPWHPADRQYIEYLVRHTGYQPTPWEDAQRRTT